MISEFVTSLLSETCFLVVTVNSFGFFFLCGRKFVISLNDFNLKPRQVFVRASLSFCPTCFPMLIKNSIYLGFSSPCSFSSARTLTHHPACTAKIFTLAAVEAGQISLTHFNGPCSCGSAQTMALFYTSKKTKTKTRCLEFIV